MSTERQDMEKFFAERGFGLRVGFGTRPAVLVIDFMIAFTDPNLPLGSDLAEELAETSRILKAAREADVPIYYTVVYYDQPGFKDAGVWLKKQKGILSLPAGSPQVELDPRLGRLPQEPVILKKYASAFFGTDLISRLTAQKVDTVIVTGCTTSGCVRATSVDALQYGFHVIIPAEGVGDRARLAHEQSLFDLNAKYADVVPTEDVISYLSGLGKT